MFNLNFNALGSPKAKRSVAEVFQSFTQELQDISAEQESVAAQLTAEIAEKQVKLSAATDEITKAQGAVEAFRKLFGG